MMHEAYLLNRFRWVAQTIQHWITTFGLEAAREMARRWTDRSYAHSDETCASFRTAFGG